MTETGSNTDRASRGEATPQPSALDLAKYRTPELAEHLRQLLSIPRSLLKLGFTTVLVGFVISAASLLIAYVAEVTAFRAVLVSAYGLFVGFLLGCLLGLLRIATNSLANLEGILGTMVRTVEHISNDYADLKSGKAALPNPHDLFVQVYEQIFLPTLEDVVRGMLGVFGKPLLFGYRWTLGSALRQVLSQTDRQFLTEEQQSNVHDKAMTGMGAVATTAPQTTRYLTIATSVVNGVGRRIRWYAIAPAYAVMLTSLAVALIPIIIVCFVL